MKHGMGYVLAGMMVLFPVFSAETVTTTKANVAKHVIHPVLTLDRLNAVQTQKRYGDQLYLSLSIRPSGTGPTVYQRVPEEPDHWLSQLLSKYKPMTLWSGPLTESESIIVVVELDEYDAYDPDDLLGSVRVKLTNQKGKLVVEWDMPNCPDVAKITVGKKPESHQFDLLKGGAHYEMALTVKR